MTGQGRKTPTTKFICHHQKSVHDYKQKMYHVFVFSFVVVGFSCVQRVFFHGCYTQWNCRVFLRLPGWGGGWGGRGVEREREREREKAQGSKNRSKIQAAQKNNPHMTPLKKTH